MHKSHNLFVGPDDPHGAIWRYMDFTKFVALLESRATFFCRADLFEDPYEGTLPSRTLEAMKEEYSRNKLMDDFSPELFAGIGNRMKSGTFISCWHMNDVESAAMWRVFLKSNEGIAIRSTYQRLCDSLQSATQDVHIGKVKYVNFETTHVPAGNMFYPLMHKRLSYEHERELRALVSDFKYVKHDCTETPPPGLTVNMNIETLIEGVYVAPGAPSWFGALVKSVVDRYSLKAPVIQSDLQNRPKYY